MTRLLPQDQLLDIPVGYRNTRQPELRDRAETLGVRLGPRDGVTNEVLEGPGSFGPQLVELHVAYRLCSVWEELPAEQSAGRSRSCRWVALHSAISMVDGHHMAAGGGTATATKQSQQTLDGSRNGGHILARFYTYCRNIEGVTALYAFQKD